MKKSYLIGIMATVAIISIYLLGQHHGRTGEGLIITKDAVAAESPSKASPVKARARDFYAPNRGPEAG